MLGRLQARWQRWMGPKVRPHRSYSGTGEDMIVRFIFEAMGIRNPVYLDIGAHDPFFISNTAHFYECGFRGVNIEANPILFREFVKHRKEDVNLNIGVTAEGGEMTFYVMNASTMSTFSQAEAERMASEHGFCIERTIRVPTKPIEQIVRENPVLKTTHFLTIDIEGNEMAVLRSIDYKHWSPTVICVETVPFGNTGRAEKNREPYELLKANGYFAFGDTYLNTIFVKEDAWTKRGT